ncbi:unnamed protein product [Zymoseptoria tritici ST99CH_1A5]|uniref:MARVEL domain-containing protein n=4 Tax=Zymoseptoria tritici TaxID=1047171 RepID=F9WZL3_ZYMTI|nr:uncharacterized protein MYCGRDRAFT_102052 [Zymoseptoria tritici IPO323]SMQ45100.1 unnamed protein product [Zymoseptoria tritici ST99CH_3D7]SMR41451.1 unnamed protein product [Zymoseptoria tritici ST99CH_1E4]SMR43652.1 unnamed protein product [Zymoseptoria tritici ST99CH_3D1]SMY18801.1 unnamed protein product [Zymoseptoria tritici ST99CH_1A5]EGP92684.1 hypothetical protein MYCGRDRAFT_102052 [Zymoseptoria tritici IPO323]
MANIINLALRGFQFFCTLIVMALVGNMIAMGADPAVVNYTMFCAVIAMLALIFLIPATIKEEWSIMPAIPFALDAIIVLFWFCAAVALAARLGAHSCSNNDYLRSNSVIRGASQRGSACREGQAATAFLWFGWAAFVGSLVFTGLGLKGGSPARGGIRRGPAMSQV